MLNTYHAKSLCAREVRVFEPQFLASIARHYKIRIWPGTTDKVGAKGKVTSSNQDSKGSYFIMQSVGFGKGFCSFFYEYHRNSN